MSDPERLELGPAASRRPWMPLAALLGAVALVVAVVVWPRADDAHTAPVPTPTVAPTVPTTPPPPRSTRVLRPPPPPPTDTWYASRIFPYPDAPDDLRLLLASNQGLNVVDLAAGRITIFPTPRVAGDLATASSVVPLGDGVVFQRFGGRPYLLTNDARLRPLPRSTDTARPTDVRWFPGPDARWPLWRDVDELGRHSLAAVDLAGNVRPVDLPDPDAAWTVRSDGRGGLLAQASDQTTYAVGLDGAIRVSDHPVVAIGPTRWLTLHCDGNGPCWYEVVDPTGTLAPRRLPGTASASSTGTVSDDGATAIVQTPLADGHSQLTLIDLATGERRPAGQLEGFATSLVFSPDGRLVLSPLWEGTSTENSIGLLLVVDVARARATQLQMPGVSNAVALAVDTAGQRWE